MTIIRSLPDDVRARLAELNADLTPEILREALIRGEIGRNACSALDPGPLVGMTFWGRTIRGLREQLFVVLWKKRERPQSLTISPDARIAIAVATGTIATGNKDADPTTKWPKGAATAKAIKLNRQLFLFPNMTPKEEEERIKEQTYETWVLLFRRVRVEAESGKPIDAQEALELNDEVLEFNDEALDLDDEALDLDDDAFVEDDIEIGNQNELETDGEGDGGARTFIQCEFSLPERFTIVESLSGKKSVRITKWRERLILEKIDITDVEISSVDRKESDSDDEMEIEITRRK